MGLVALCDGKRCGRKYKWGWHELQSQAKMAAQEKPERESSVSLHFDHVIRVVTHIPPSRLLYLIYGENCSKLFVLVKAFF